jgi:hypothetical protein
MRWETSKRSTHRHLLFPKATKSGGHIAVVWLSGKTWDANILKAGTMVRHLSGMESLPVAKARAEKSAKEVNGL